MAYKHINPEAGLQGIHETSTVQNHPLGLRVQAYDPVYGVGEFIYLIGVASTVIGDLVVYDTREATSTRAVAASRGPAAVAMSANVASQYGWYQIFGQSVVKAGTVADNSLPYLTATAGTVDDAVVAGQQIDNARIKSADGTPAAGFAVMHIAYPAMNGQG